MNEISMALQFGAFGIMLVIMKWFKEYLKIHDERVQKREDNYREDIKSLVGSKDDLTQELIKVVKKNTEVISKCAGPKE